MLFRSCAFHLPKSKDTRLWTFHASKYLAVIAAASLPKCPAAVAPRIPTLLATIITQIPTASPMARIFTALICGRGKERAIWGDDGTGDTFRHASDGDAGVGIVFVGWDGQCDGEESEEGSKLHGCRVVKWLRDIELAMRK